MTRTAPQRQAPAAPGPSLWHRDGSRVHLTMHSGQSRAMASKARFVFVLAGTQGGKTSWGPWWLYREIERTADPEGGTNDYAAVTASYDLFKLKMLPAIREVFEHLMGRGRYWSSDRVIELKDPKTGKYWANKSDDPMWGRIILRSASAGSGLESMTARGAWLDECGMDEVTLENWEAVLRRLSIYQGRVLGTTTPYNLGWIKQAVYDPWRAGDNSFEVIQFPSFINPVFPKAEYERAKASMPQWRFDMFYRGMFGRPAGLIYDCFDPETHVVTPAFEPPATWVRWGGVDFGAVNTATLWAAVDPGSGMAYIYRETLEGGQTTQQHVARELAHTAGQQVRGVYGGAPSEGQQRMDWGAAGMNVRQPPIVDVEAGIDRVTELLRTNRLRVMANCRGLCDEFGTYSRKLDASGSPTEEINDKRLFHRLDALRYLAAGMVIGTPRTGRDIWE